MVQRELVKLASSGDREALSALAASVVDRLYATAVLILRDHCLADDATQETICAPGATCRSRWPPPIQLRPAGARTRVLSNRGVT